MTAPLQSVARGSDTPAGTAPAEGLNPPSSLSAGFFAGMSANKGGK